MSSGRSASIDSTQPSRRSLTSSSGMWSCSSVSTAPGSTTVVRVGVRDPLEQHHARVVDEGVQVTEGVDRLADEIIDGVAVGHVRRDDQRLAGPVLDIVGERLQSVGAPGGQRHRHPLVGQCPGGRRADTGGGTGHDRHLPVHVACERAHGRHEGWAPHEATPGGEGFAVPTPAAQYRTTASTMPAVWPTPTRTRPATSARWPPVANSPTR
jgi:hypothetical protein